MKVITVKSDELWVEDRKKLWNSLANYSNSISHFIDLFVEWNVCAVLCMFHVKAGKLISENPFDVKSILRLMRKSIGLNRTSSCYWEAYMRWHRSNTLSCFPFSVRSILHFFSVLSISIEKLFLFIHLVGAKEKIGHKTQALYSFSEAKNYAVFDSFNLFTSSHCCCKMQ
jgi:hypothetical protein